MARRMIHFMLPLLFVLVLHDASAARQAQKPLSNDDVIAMVKNKLPESVVISAIQSRPGNFKTSTSELIRLQKAGVTENEMNAMIAANGKGAAGATRPKAASDSPVAPSAAAFPVSRSHLPKLYLVQDGGFQELPLEKTQLAETKTKPTSMKKLAADAAVTQTMQAEITTASDSVARHINSGFGSSSVQQAGSIFSGIVSHRSPMVTYVWGVPNPASTNVLQTVSPNFAVDFSRAIGINPDDYEPTIVKLTPAQNTCRILGATQGKQDARSSPAADWQIYSHFLEDRVATTNEKVATGKYRISPASGLPPGEYAVVLRPISKQKRFSGGDVARAQGEGLVFDAAWTFQISDDAE
jgi:hypothetical protein